MSQLLFLFALFACVAISACGDEADTERAPAPVVYATSDDPAMNSAIEKARRQLDSFESVLNAPAPAQSGFGIKVGLPHAGGVEHVWLGQPLMEADSVTGIVEDAPVYATQVRRGQHVRVSRDAISDWMYLENGKLQGGYTMRIAIDRLPAAQRDEQRKVFGIE